MDFRITEEQELMVQEIEEAMTEKILSLTSRTVTKTTHIQRNGGKS
mgnify:CR=1 FL=1